MHRRGGRSGWDRVGAARVREAITSEEGERWLEEMRVRARKGTYFASLTLMMAAGTKA